jgi:TonB-dependent starch-binding outer membrane protein SusC
MQQFLKHRKKIYHFMKLTVLQTVFAVVLVGFSHAHPSYSQKVLMQRINLSVENQPVSKVLTLIEDMVDVRFSYLSKQIQADRKVTLALQNEVLSEVLDIVFDNSGVYYEIVGSKQILLTKNLPSRLLEKTEVMISPISYKNEKSQLIDFVITGTVRDSKGETMVGATVMLQGTQKGTLTDADGTYSLELSEAEKNGSLIFSFVGYEEQIIPIAGKSVIDVVLVDGNTLSEVVVVGYGSQAKQKISTAISSVKVDDIDQGAGYNPVKMLQGRTSGVNIVSTSGIPGTKPVVLIRGVGSISGSSSPLYVVDGVPNEGGYPNINPNDIESMEVLKDASAAAIYGSRANSGVILITTKSGKSGKTSVSFDTWMGIGTIANDIEMANSQEYTNVMQVAVDNYNKQKNTTLQFYKPAEDQIEETDWTKAISRPSAQSRNHNLSISGGNDKTTFYTSFGIFNQQGIFLRSQYDQYSFRIKAGHEISPYIKLNTNLSMNLTDRVLLEEENSGLKILRTAREEQPWYSPFTATGDYKVNGTQLIRHNPLMLINEEDWTSKRYEGVGTISVDIKPFKGFKYTPAIKAFASFFDEKKTLTERMVARWQSAGWGAIAQNKNTDLRYIIENILQYSGQTSDLEYTFLAGHSFEKYSSEDFGALSDNYANGAFPSSNFGLINAGPNIYASGIGYNAFALESYIGRVNFAYKNKYMLNASLRTDGASKFSEGKRYGTFPSISAAWLIGNEDFLQNQNWVNDLKLRASFGITGSISGVGNFASRSLITAGNNSYNGQSGFAISRIGQDLTWEKAQQVNVGIDAAFLKNRLNVSVDIFQQRTTDLLYDKPIQSTSGFSTIAANIGTVENRGVEFSASGRIFDNDFKWELGGNVSFIKNNLVSLFDDVQTLVVPASGSGLFGGQMHALIVGQPISTYFMYEQTGIYQNDSEVPEKLLAKGVRAGDVIYKDINGDNDISDADRHNVGKAIPDFFGGITSDFSYKGFELNIFGQFSVGNKVMASWRGVNGTEGTDHLGNAFSNTKLLDGKTVEQFFGISKNAALNYWNGPGTSNTTPRPVRRGVHTGYGTAGYNFLTSTRFLEDASYFRFRTITLAYNVPVQALGLSKVFSKIRAYVTFDNFITFTKYTGYDPEQSLTASPGDANYGVDFGLQPSLKTVLFGFNIKF